MKLENSFQVPAPPPRVWDFLLDLERVTPCMPGAELEELVDESTWKGKISVKLGAVSLTYATTVVVDDRDDDTLVVVLKAKARETRGRGSATAAITSSVGAAGEGRSQVALSTDLTVSGAVAQNARGMIGDISERLTAEFAACLGSRISASADVPAEPVAPAAPIGGMRMGAWALWRAVRRSIGRIWRAVSSPFRRD